MPKQLATDFGNKFKNIERTNDIIKNFSTGAIITLSIILTIKDILTKTQYLKDNKENISVYKYIIDKYMSLINQLIKEVKQMQSTAKYNINDKSEDI